MSDPRPYADTWQRYRQSGWLNVLPLPFMKKKSPPSGFTGHDGHAVTEETAAMWATKPYYDNDRYARGNICLGMPDNVIGIDIDHYGEKSGADTLAELESRLGELPLGPASTNRPGTPSMIRFFRVPDGRKWIHNLPGIEIIQRTHRYAVVYPSVHPEGRLYHWLDLRRGSLEPEYIPYVSDLPHLPEAWIDELTEEAVYTKPTTAREFTIIERDEILTDGEACKRVQRGIGKYLEKVNAGKSQHDSCNQTQLDLVRLGERGHRGVARALEVLRELFCTDVEKNRSGAAPRPRPSSTAGCTAPSESLPTRPQMRTRDAATSQPGSTCLPSSGNPERS